MSGYTHFATSFEESKERWEKASNLDPFPKIPASLLNSADLYDYVMQTGLVYEFDPDSRKSASLSIRIGRKYIRWTDEGKFEEKDLKTGEEISFPPNSIVYVTTEETFFLPNYIAMRFNLHIEFVHRGLLLGTGPLVDPGFAGQLLIPIHNLTTNNYTALQGEDLIWVEFTKTTPNQEWDAAHSERVKDYSLSGVFQFFRPEKQFKDTAEYLNRARAKVKGGAVLYNSIQSSIPEALNQTKTDASEAKKDVERARRLAEDAELKVEKINKEVRNFSIGALAVLMMSLAAIGIPVFGLIQDSAAINGSIRAELRELKSALEAIKNDTLRSEKNMMDEGTELRRVSSNLSANLARIQAEIDKLEMSWNEKFPGSGNQ